MSVAILAGQLLAESSHVLLAVSHTVRHFGFAASSRWKVALVVPRGWTVVARPGPAAAVASDLCRGHPGNTEGCRSACQDGLHHLVRLSRAAAKAHPGAMLMTGVRADRQQQERQQALGHCLLDVTKAVTLKRRNASKKPIITQRGMQR